MCLPPHTFPSSVALSLRPALPHRLLLRIASCPTPVYLILLHLATPPTSSSVHCLLSGIPPSQAACCYALARLASQLFHAPTICAHDAPMLGLRVAMNTCTILHAQP